jgi:hypothetical protein
VAICATIVLAALIFLLSRPIRDLPPVGDVSPIRIAFVQRCAAMGRPEPSPVLCLQTPIHVRPNGTSFLFKVVGDGETAERVPVELGRGSDGSVEVLGGLSLGDRAIVSDMSAYDNVRCVELR